MKLSSEQIHSILNNAPRNIDRAEILDSLVRKGYTLEGVDMAQAQQRVSRIQLQEAEDAEQEESLLKRTSKGLSTVFGGERIGEVIGTQVAKFLPGGRELRKQEAAGLVPEGTFEETFEGPEAKQVVGDIAEVGLTFAGLKGVGTAGKLLARVAKQSSVGAGFGISSALADGKEEEAVSRAFLGGVLGGAFPLAGAVVKKTRDALTVTLPEKLFQQIFKQADDDLRLAWQAEAKGAPINPTLAREALDEGLRGRSKNMAIHSFKKLGDLEKQVQATIADPGKTISVPRKQAYVELLEEIQGRFGKGSGAFFSERADEAGRLIKQLDDTPGDAIRLDTALPLRRFIDGMRNTSSFRLDPNLAPRQEEYKRGADILRRQLADAGLGDLMAKERIYIQALDEIIGEAARRGNRRVIGLTDILLGGGGITTGAPLGGIGAAGAVRGFQQPFTLTNLGVGLDRLGKFLPSVPETAKRVTRTAALRAATEN